MMKVFMRTLTFGVLLSAVPALAVAGDGVRAGQAKPVTATEAAPFLGDWTLTLQGPNGPGTFALSVKTESEKVSAEISSDVLGTQPITSISLVDKSLVLGFSFNYEGNAVEAAVSLTPDKEGKTAAQIDFAGGAYTMTGTAEKKEKAKGE
jgi:hypothetical protein